MAAASSSGEQSQEPGTQWTVWVDRSAGANLGIRIDIATMMIEKIHPQGLLACHNDDTPTSAVRAGDFILSVNGQTSSEAAIEQCKTNQWLEFVFLRKAQPSLNAEQRAAETLQVIME